MSNLQEEHINFKDILNDVGESYSYKDDDTLFENHSEKKDENITKDEASDTSLKIKDNNIIVDSNGLKYIKNTDASKDKKINNWSDSPIVKNQKTHKDLYRIKTKRIEVFNLDNQDQQNNLNDLIEKSMNDTSNIINLNLLHKFSETTGSWKILATYDVIEFKTQL